ncbi:MAG: hypothetical protein K0R27_556 [Xanthobacteraceae bacterium]|nr:hypothetical protein [Xanthobacteraceae bacterium]
MRGPGETGMERQRNKSFPTRRTLCLCALALVASVSARADELSDLSTRIMANPANIATSLEYAKLAETNGKPRWALAAYERVLMLDPTNTEAWQGLSRVRWHMEPATTVWTLDGGVFVDTNPYRTGAFDVWGDSPNPYLYVFSAYPEKTDTFYLAGVSMRDDRPAGDLRWRTTARVEQQMWVDNSQLDGGYVTAASGPMFQLTPQIAVRLASMATFSWLNNGLDSIEMPNPWYPDWSSDKTIEYGPGGDDPVRFWEVGGLIGFEGYLNGAMQRVDISVGYRTYGEAYSSSEGMVVGVVGRFTRPNAIVQGDAFTMQPWFRWADLGEPSDRDEYIYWDGVRSGSITEAGVKFGYSKPLTSWLTAVGTMEVDYRETRFSWENDPWGYRPKNSLQEVVFAPGIALVLPDFFRDGLDLRFEYVYEYTDTNADNGEIAAQTFGTSFAYRF